MHLQSVCSLTRDEGSTMVPSTCQGPRLVWLEWLGSGWISLCSLSTTGPLFLQDRSSSSKLIQASLHGVSGQENAARLFFFNINLFIYLSIYLFIYFWLHWVFVAAHGLSLVAASGLSLVAASRGYSSKCAGFSLQWLFLLWSTGSRHTGFSSCGTWAQ